MQAVVAREGGQPLERRRDGRAEQLRDGDELGRGVDRAPAAKDGGVFRGPQDPGRARDVGGGRRVAGAWRRLERGPLAGLAGLQLQVDGNLDEYRPRLAARRDAPGLVQHGDHVRVPLDAPARLGDRREQRVLVHVVQLVGPAEVASHAAGDDEHRDAVEEGLADAARGMRHARRRHDGKRADAGAGAADGIGHERAAALVRDEYGRDGFGGAELVVELGVVHAGNAEREADPQLFQRFPGEPRRRLLHAASVKGQRSASGGEAAGRESGNHQALIMRQSPSP